MWDCREESLLARDRIPDDLHCRPVGASTSNDVAFDRFTSDHHDDSFGALLVGVRIVRAVLLGLTLLVVLTSCGTTNTGKLSDRLELSTTHTASGPSIKATFVINNPGSAINLTPASREVGGQASGGCEPDFAVYLTNGNVNNEVGFNEDCSSAPFLIPHGTTRLPFTLDTTFTSCGDPATPNDPGCLASGGFPPLPPGTYKAEVEWSDKVPVPAPKPVSVTIVG